MNHRPSAEDVDATRRTYLASERTELAWWRTGLTALAVALGVGRVVPGLDENAVKVCDGVYLSTSARVLQHVIVDPDQSRARLIAGYAGWGPGQLDEEVAAHRHAVTLAVSTAGCAPSACAAASFAACVRSIGKPSASRVL